MRTPILFVLGSIAAWPVVAEAQPSTSVPATPLAATDPPASEDEEPIDEDAEEEEPDDGEPDDDAAAPKPSIANRDPVSLAVAPLAAVPTVRLRYPRAVIDRPAILPLGLGHAGLDVELGPPGRDALVGGGIGLPWHADLHVGYATPLATTGASRVSMDLGVRVHETRAFAVAWRARVERERGTDRAATVLTGLRVAAVAGSKFAAWLRAEQLAIDLDGTPVSLGLPLSLGIQLTPRLWLQADADIRLVELVDRKLARTEVDVVPAAVGAILSLAPRLDLRLRAAGDVGERGWIVSSTRVLLGLDYLLGG